MTDDQMPDDVRAELEQARAELFEARGRMAETEAQLHDFLTSRGPETLRATPEQAGPTITAEALRRHGDRVRFFCDAIRDDSEAEMSGRWHEVISQETAFLVEEGPAAYLAYLARLDDAAARAEVDRFLDATFPPGGEA